MRKNPMEHDLNNFVIRLKIMEAKNWEKAQHAWNNCFAMIQHSKLRWACRMYPETIVCISHWWWWWFSGVLANINYKWSAFLYWVVQINENEHHLLTNKMPNQLCLPVSLHIGNEFIHSIQNCVCQLIRWFRFSFVSYFKQIQWNWLWKIHLRHRFMVTNKPCWYCAEIDRQQQKKSLQ